MGLVICAVATSAPHSSFARRVPNSWFRPPPGGPAPWGPNGEWEARTLETGVPLIVCNRSGHGQDRGAVKCRVTYAAAIRFAQEAVSFPAPSGWAPARSVDVLQVRAAHKASAVDPEGPP